GAPSVPLGSPRRLQPAGCGERVQRGMRRRRLSVRHTYAVGSGSPGTAIKRYKTTAACKERTRRRQRSKGWLGARSCARAADAFGANLLFLGLSPEYLEAAQQFFALVGGAPAGSYRSGAERDRLGHTVVAHQVEDPEDRVGIVFPYRPEQVGGDGGTLAG